MKMRKIYQPYLLRPMIYLTAFRLMLSAIFLLALVRFIPQAPSPAMVAGFLAVLFALFAYLVYLRLDGLGVPRMKYLRPKKKSDPTRHFASMSDHTDDDPPVPFEELEPEEKDFCSLLANVICLAVFTGLSFVL